MTQTVGAKKLEFPYGAWPDVSASKAAKALRNAGVTCSVVSLPARIGRIGEPGHRQEMLSLVEGALRTAQWLEAQYVQLHTLVSSSALRSQIIQDLANQLRPICDLAERMGLGVLLENNFDPRNEDPEGINPARHGTTMMRLRDAIDADNFGFCFDPSNSFVTDDCPYPDEYDALSNLIRNVHVKDCQAATSGAKTARSNAIARDSVTGTFEWVPLGTGRVDWFRILGELSATGYDGPLAIEPVETTAMEYDEWTYDAAKQLRYWLDDLNEQEK